MSSQKVYTGVRNHGAIVWWSVLHKGEKMHMSFVSARDEEGALELAVYYFARPNKGILKEDISVRKAPPG